MGEYAFDVDQVDFGEKVLKSEVPVVVDFWAPWCAPCKTLKPMLEKLAAEYSGRFLLAKVNSEENPDLAGKYGVRGIPDVRVFVHGEVVDGFTGALPESALRSFLEKAIPSPSEELRRKAAGLDPEAAQAMLMDALRMDPGNEAARLDLAENLLDKGAIEPAKELIRSIGPAHTGRVERIRARISFLEAGSSSEDEETLKNAVAVNPENDGARLALAKLYASQQNYEAALEQLLEAIRRDRKNEAARKTMLSIFELASDQAELVSRYRKMLASALY